MDKRGCWLGPWPGEFGLAQPARPATFPGLRQWSSRFFPAHRWRRGIDLACSTGILALLLPGIAEDSPRVLESAKSLAFRRSPGKWVALGRSLNPRVRTSAA